MNDGLLWSPSQEKMEAGLKAVSCGSGASFIALGTRQPEPQLQIQLLGVKPSSGLQGLIEDLYSWGWVLWGSQTYPSSGFPYARLNCGFHLGQSQRDSEKVRDRGMWGGTWSHRGADTLCQGSREKYRVSGAPQRACLPPSSPPYTSQDPRGPPAVSPVLACPDPSEQGQAGSVGKSFLPHHPWGCPPSTLRF